ncbi:hypothetical protein [Streptomyces sp. MUM 178J]|uniref:hypothetical protein n=1 Tax=Streptomyces sp. MUM 178J TaxID=2791991 RepID=UPI001F04FD4A|nr:hypothetical protein [Streptomyces sp. MUM 178J]WRQ81805.1 hypothetical protein I3F59_021950 [Streptomyces sp. MUM 178J]
MAPIGWDRLGTRPKRERLHDESEPLSDGLLLALFLVLFWQKQAQDASRRANS